MAIILLSVGEDQFRVTWLTPRVVPVIWGAPGSVILACGPAPAELTALTLSVF